MKRLAQKKAFIIDMDGVIYHGNRLLPGAGEFVQWLTANEKRFLFMTNSSERSPKELHQKLSRMGIDVSEEHFFTSALATANFLSSQHPGGSAYVIGEAGLTNALYEAGLTMNDVNPDYVVVGDTRTYSYERIERAVQLIMGGARLVAPIELATNRKAYFVGKPNPLMMRHALKKLESRREETAIIGDRMDTDIVAGIEAEIETVLVLSGVTSRENLPEFPYSPHYILDGVNEIPT